MAPIRRRLPERALAWVFTGPLGHLWSAAADVVVLWPRYLLQRRLAGAGRRSRARR